MSFQSLLCYTFPIQPFLLLQFYLSRNPEHLPFRILQRNNVCILYKLRAGHTRLVRLLFDPVCQIIVFFYQEACNAWLSHFVMSAAEEWCLDPSFHLRWPHSGILTLSHWLADIRRRSYQSTVWLLNSHGFLYETEDKRLILSLHSPVFKKNVS